MRLDDPGVRKHGDWDNMGQRGTCSQTITYDNIFVPKIAFSSSREAKKG